MELFHIFKRFNKYQEKEVLLLKRHFQFSSCHIGGDFIINPSSQMLCSKEKRKETERSATPKKCVVVHHSVRLDVLWCLCCSFLSSYSMTTLKKKKQKNLVLFNPIKEPISDVKHELASYIIRNIKTVSTSLSLKPSDHFLFLTRSGGALLYIIWPTKFLCKNNVSKRCYTYITIYSYYIESWSISPPTLQQNYKTAPLGVRTEQW